MIKSGAGASVSSGANFQARVAAYVKAISLCDTDSPITAGVPVKLISFETAEAIDDLNVELENGELVYIQAKASMGYSTKEDSELYSVLDQFVRQHLKKKPAAKYLLATTGRSSKKLIYDLRAALEAFRTSPSSAFERDQPKAVQEIISQLRSRLSELIQRYGGKDEIRSDEVMKAMHVVVLDLEDGAPLEEACIVLMDANGFVPSRAVWAKLISDALTHSKHRHTIKLIDIRRSYERFRTVGGKAEGSQLEEILAVEFGEMQFPAGKEVVLCEIVRETLGIDPGAAIIEMYRFDEDCQERVKFSDDEVELLDGTKLRLIRRAATLTGMSRLLETNPELVGDTQLAIVPINSEENFEESSCAELHRQRLKDAALANPQPLACLHCAKPISSNNTAVVETGSVSQPRVGMVHDKCLQPAYRILGLAQSDFFEQHPELVKFDANGWFKAAHGGQMAFAGASMMSAAGPPIMAWGGRDSTGPIGDYVVEVALQNGEREIVTERNAVHRFTRDEAEAFAALLNEQFENGRREGDPHCYSDQSKTFGLRSLVLKVVGGSEVIRQVDKARVREFQTEFAERYSRPGQWYAPVIYLVRGESGEPIGKDDAIFLITDPLTLGNRLENWRQAGVLLEGYEVRSILTDNEFDEFMRWTEDHGQIAVANPLFDVSTGDPVSGLPIMSLEMAQNLSASKVP